MSKSNFYGNRQIARLLLLAHEANLIAKDKFPIVEMPEITQDIYADFYALKLRYFMQAIKLIQNMKNSDFTFWVEAAPDQNGYPSIITYFELKRGIVNTYFQLKGSILNPRYEKISVDHKIQVSFHTPLNLAPKELIKLVQKGKPTIWTKIAGDRDSIEYLAKHYNIMPKNIIEEMHEPCTTSLKTEQMIDLHLKEVEALEEEEEQLFLLEENS